MTTGTTTRQQDAAESRRPRRPLLAVRRIALWLAIVFVTVYLVRAFDSRRGVRIETWHSVSLDEEFRAADLTDSTRFEDFLAAEGRVFEELDRRVYDTLGERDDLGLTRFRAGGHADPRRFEPNWNRTFELEHDAPRGGVLLVHGLTDSPYSMRRIGEILHADGLHVLAVRLPGHGTNPGSLVDASWRDWKAAIRLAARRVRERVGANGSLVVVGYSLGGPLAVDYTIDALLEEEDPVPDRVLLLSPAIGVTPFALVASWHGAVSWIPFFEAFRWQVVEPEYDPYKYVSFPKNAADQTRAVTIAVQDGLDRLEKAKRIERFPPITVVQSLVDSTVSTEAIVTELLERLGTDGNELVLYDINREAQLRPLFTPQPRALLEAWQSDSGRAYRLTLLTNESPTSRRVVIETRAAGEVTPSIEPLELEWPRDVYSMSHVALPFAPDDPVYGRVRAGDEFNLGALEPRGERGLLRISLNNLMRLRYNPFFEELAERVRDAAR